MAKTEAKTETAVKVEPTKEKITLPRARNGEDSTMFVSINGVNYLVPKGKAVEVPAFVAREIERARKADEYYHDRADALQRMAE